MEKKYPVKNLASVCFKITDGSHFSPEMAEKGYPYITVRDINDDKIDFSNCKYVSKDDYEALKKNGCAPKYGDLLFSKDGTVGKVAIVDTNKQFVVLSSLAIITPDEKQITSEFLFYVLKSPAFLQEAVGRKTGAAIRRIILKHLKSIEFPLPPLPVQKAIVAKLDAAFASIDTAIAAAERNAENAKQLFQRYLSDVFDRGGEGWEEKTLNQVCAVERGSSPRPIQKYVTNDVDGVNWIKIGDTEEGGKYVYKTKQKISREGALKSRHVKSGDFILTNSMSYGRPYIMRTEGYIHDGWFVFRLNKNLDAEYFFYLLSSPFIQKQFEELAAGSVVKNISGDLVKKTKLPIPSYAIQQKLAEDFLRLEDESIKLRSIYGRKADLVRELKQSLLHQAFTGQLVEA